MAVQEHPVSRRTRRAVRALMASQDVSGPVLASRLEMRPQNLYNRLNGKTGFRLDELGVIADELDTSVEDLVAGRVTVPDRFPPLPRDAVVAA